MRCMCVDLTNVFDQFLPQLLSYPNPLDPLNGEAASLYLHKPDDYSRKVKGVPLPLSAPWPSRAKGVRVSHH